HDRADTEQQRGGSEEREVEEKLRAERGLRRHDRRGNRQKNRAAGKSPPPVPSKRCYAQAVRCTSARLPCWQAQTTSTRRKSRRSWSWWCASPTPSSRRRTWRSASAHHHLRSRAQCPCRRRTSQSHRNT